MRRKALKHFKVTLLIRTTHFQFCPYVSHYSMLIWTFDATQLDLATSKTTGHNLVTEHPWSSVNIIQLKLIRHYCTLPPLISWVKDNSYDTYLRQKFVQLFL